MLIASFSSVVLIHFHLNFVLRSCMDFSSHCQQVPGSFHRPHLHHSQSLEPDHYFPRRPFFKCMIKIPPSLGDQNINLTNGIFTGRRGSNSFVRRRRRKATVQFTSFRFIICKSLIIRTLVRLLHELALNYKFLEYLFVFVLQSESPGI